MYSSDPYELEDGTTVSGKEAECFRMLDERDPISNDLEMNDAETLEELRALYPEMLWCPQLRCVVSPTPFDTYEESIDTGKISERIMAMNRYRRRWAANMAARAHGASKRDEKLAMKFAKYAEQASSASRIGGVVKLFCQTAIVDQNRLNTEPCVLGTPLGVLDMDSGMLSADDGNDATIFKVTQSTNANIDSTLSPSLAYDTRWDEFVLEIMCGDGEKAAYLQRALGYSAMGGNPEECMFVAYGASTRNGKNTLLDSVQHALGGYAASAERGFLLSGGRQGGTDEALASLSGKRFVTISEPPKDRKLDESKVKSLTSCDMQSTSKKFGSQFEFKPQFTMWMSCNHLPKVEDDSVFASGRIRVIPFERHFTEAERDTSLKHRFTSENGSYTVLRWLLQGYLMYKEKGLAEPESIRVATEGYVSTGGTTADKFLRSCCVIRADGKVENKLFQGVYKDYCENILGEAPMSAQKLREALEPYGIVKKPSDSREWWFGVYFNIESEAIKVLKSAENSSRKSTETVKKSDSEAKPTIKIK